MQVVERTSLVSFTAAQMFALVDDVARYPEFLPWCTGSSVVVNSATARLATVQLARGVLKSAFTTRNEVIADSRIDMQLVEGPFNALNGTWRFEPIADRGSRVSFRVEFEFRNRLTAAAFNSVFESLCGTIIDAFVQRARSVYG